MLHFYDLKLNNRDPVYQQAALYVKKQILLGKAVSGDKLPSRREVASQLNINPNTVQKAFKLMEDEGFVRTSSTSGSVVYVDDEIFRRIEAELTQELVKSFVDSAKEIQMPYKRVIELISEQWD